MEEPCSFYSRSSLANHDRPRVQDPFAGPNIALRRTDRHRAQATSQAGGRARTNALPRMRGRCAVPGVRR